LRLNATDRAKHCNRSIENTQGPLDLNRKIDMPRRVNDVDSVLGILLLHALPKTRSRSRGNRYTSFLFLFHPIHNGIAVMNLTQLVGDTRIKKDALSRCRLTGINMSHDTDIAVALERDGSCHDVS
jgi:hypothetical protein